MANDLFSKMVKAGKNTYFVDVKEAKNGNKYLAITETQAGNPQRKTIRVFGEAIGKLRDTVQEAAATIPNETSD